MNLSNVFVFLVFFKPFALCLSSKLVGTCLCAVLHQCSLVDKSSANQFRTIQPHCCVHNWSFLITQTWMCNFFFRPLDFMVWSWNYLLETTAHLDWKPLNVVAWRPKPHICAQMIISVEFVSYTIFTNQTKVALCSLLGMVLLLSVILLFNIFFFSSLQDVLNAFKCHTPFSCCSVLSL